MKTPVKVILVALLAAAAYVGSFLYLEKAGPYPIGTQFRAYPVFYYPLRVIKWTHQYPPPRFIGVVTSQAPYTLMTTFQDDRPGGKAVTIVCSQSEMAGMTHPGQKAVIRHSVQVPLLSYWPEHRVISVIPLPDIGELGKAAPEFPPQYRFPQ